MNSENILEVNILDEKIAVFTLTNPNRRNPLSLSLIFLLQKELDKIKKNKKIKVLIIQSTGPSFCSGHDLKEVEKFSKSQVKLLDLFNKCSKMMLSLRKLNQPVIACVDGLASAAGCQLVASCDLVIASKSSKFQTPGVNIGLFCSTPMVAVSRKLATKDMMFMLLSGQVIKAEEARNFKLVNKVVSKASLKKEEEYFSSKSHRLVLNQPLLQADRKSELDVVCTVVGGGLSGQAGAIRHGISRALVNFDPSLRKTLKSKGFLTRDSRGAERKKYGKAKARRSYQFSKR